MRKYAPLLTLLLGVAVGWVLRTPARHPADMQPDRLVVSHPEDGGRAVHYLRVTRSGTSHESDALRPGCWRVVLSAPAGTWFFEADYVSTETDLCQ